MFQNQGELLEEIREHLASLKLGGLQSRIAKSKKMLANMSVPIPDTVESTPQNQKQIKLNNRNGHKKKQNSGQHSDDKELPPRQQQEKSEKQKSQKNKKKREKRKKSRNNGHENPGVNVSIKNKGFG